MDSSVSKSITARFEVVSELCIRDDFIVHAMDAKTAHFSIGNIEFRCDEFAIFAKPISLPSPAVAHRLVARAQIRNPHLRSMAWMPGKLVLFRPLVAQSLDRARLESLIHEMLAEISQLFHGTDMCSAP